MLFVVVVDVNRNTDSLFNGWSLVADFALFVSKSSSDVIHALKNLYRLPIYFIHLFNHFILIHAHRPGGFQLRASIATDCCDKLVWKRFEEK